ncbi:MAG: SPASM domain-containing protein [Deltaproteobacteria bacterium]|nr:SPASM domain-containing protein [Deltaproteobacteria bacterium]
MRKLLRELRHAPFPLKITLNWSDEPLANPRFFELAELVREQLPEARLRLRARGNLLDIAAAERLGHLFQVVTLTVCSRADHQRLEALGNSTRSDAVFRLDAEYLAEGRRDRRGGACPPLHVPCHRMWCQAAIAANGDIHLCSRDTRRLHPVGNLSNQSLAEAFNGPQAQALRAQMQGGGRDRVAMCRRCDGRSREYFEALDADLPAGALTMPWGRHSYLAARALARALGHIALPGLSPRRYEWVVGLSPSLARDIVRTVQSRLGDALLAIWICGNRVMSRARLRLVDPSVFAGLGRLELAGKEAVREFGPDPRFSSDLDLKVLVDERRIGARAATRQGSELGRALEMLGAPFPLSGHLRPTLHLWRVPRSSAHDAFILYNAARPSAIGKGPHSPEQTVLLVDPARDVLREDATAPVRAALASTHGRSIALAKVARPSLSEGAALRARHAGLTGHQLVCALLDFPELEPRGVRVRDGRIVAGRVAVWAALAAGRTRIAIED